MKRSISRVHLLVLLFFSGLCFDFVPKARTQEKNPGKMRYYFVFQARDSKGNKLYADSPTNKKPIYWDTMRVVEKARWDPDLVKDETKDWNGRYTKGPQKKMVENAKLPPDVLDFPFNIRINFPDFTILEASISERECNDMWIAKYGAEDFRNRGWTTEYQGWYTCSFDTNCYGYATGYGYTLSARGLLAIVNDDGYVSDNQHICLWGAILKFKGDHSLWINKCCGNECEPKGLTLLTTWERNACSPVIVMKWFCLERIINNEPAGIGGGNLKGNTASYGGQDTLYYKTW